MSLGGATDSTIQCHSCSNKLILLLLSPDPHETIVGHVITLTDRDVFVCLCVFKLVNYGTC